MEEAKQVQIVPVIKQRIDRTGRRWMQDHEKKYDKLIEDYSKTSESPNKHKIMEYLEDMAIGDSSKTTEKKSITKSRRLKILQTMRDFDGCMDYKKFWDISSSEMKTFARRLKDDIIVSPYTKKPFAETTKSGKLKIIRKFWKWLKGKNRYYPEEVDWMDTREPIPTKDCYTLEEMELLFDNIHSYPMKILIKLLFDGGFRIGEMLNIRIKDVTAPTQDENWFTLRVRAEVAKMRKERGVALCYVNLDFKTFLENHHPEPNNPEAFLFYYSYQYVREFLRRKGKKLLGKNITPHNIRRTSATFFAPRIKNYQVYCHRFGWSLGSREPNRYFYGNKMHNRDMMNQVISFEMDKARTQYSNEIVTNQELIKSNEVMKLQLDKHQKEIHQRKRYDSVIQRLLSEPAIQQRVQGMLKDNLDSETKLIEAGDIQ